MGMGSKSWGNQMKLPPLCTTPPAQDMVSAHDFTPVKRSRADVTVSLPDIDGTHSPPSLWANPFCFQSKPFHLWVLLFSHRTQQQFNLVLCSSAPLFFLLLCSFFFIDLGSCITAMGMATEAQFHVLAVDDSIIDRKLIERLLKTSSYQVTTVDSGSKALEFLGLQDDDQRNPSPPSVYPSHHQEMEVNLIITDYCMPGMTGYDLLKKIKESSSLKDIPVVIMSSENVPSRINRCLEEGAEEFFLKPVQLSDVNRLRPHLLKGKSKEKQQEQPPQQQALQNQSQEPTNNKRKAMEESLSPERTRPRYSDLINNNILFI
ncbi:hypothetical protein HHK36_017183 [Tetracentron sinense]|uniref:Response regulatory domain-containing protein n=1 Tax=Tetracentron sinense TaxID=13715 RepID=A0A834Z6R2_TETSI|nr:hypothetical protein HHK36_017183 [Tetracentron sinense]